MGLLDWFRRSRIRPTPVFEDEALGCLVWSDDEDGWVGQVTVEFSLAFSGEPTPAPELVAYARQWLSSPDRLQAELEAAKRRQREEFGDVYTDELIALRYEHLGFIRRGGENGIIASLGPGRDYRAWRIEFLGSTCEGIGFDS